jgi:hypothetical protein
MNKLKRERKMLMDRFDHRLKRLNDKEHHLGINDNLYYPLQEQERLQFKSADGNELKWKASRANSSACLLLNTFSPLRKGSHIEIKEIGVFNTYAIERKLQVLNDSKRKANIDMVLSNKDSIVYIESKFTELFYYDKTYQLSQSYFKEDRYPSKDIYDAAKQLLNQFNHFDGDQLVKHAIAIYRDCLDHPNDYKNKKVFLMNLCWELHDTSYKYEDSFNLQLRAIKEATMFAYLFNRLMKEVFEKIGIEFQFVYMNYYDFIHHQTNLLELDEELINYLDYRYFFYHHRKEYKDDAIDYIKSHINHDLNLDDFHDYLNQYQLMAIENSYQKDEIKIDDVMVNIADAMIIVGPPIQQFPRNMIDLQCNEYLHIVSPIYYNKYTIIYFHKNFPNSKYFKIK